MKTREEALSLLYEWISSDSLRKHCLAVAFSMEEYAEKFIAERKLSDNIINKNIIKVNLSEKEKQEIIDNFWICGLMHDFDWERCPIMDKHPSVGSEELKKLGYPTEIIDAIMGHNYHNPNKVERKTIMAKTLFAVDELSGLIVALAKVRQGNFDGMTAESVEKAMKKKEFAKAINRDDIELGISELNIDRKKHFETVIAALRNNKKELGF